MISESQERMVAVVAPERIDDVRAVCARWELPCTVIGEVTAHGELRAFVDGEVVGAIPPRLLTDESPRYEVGQSRSRVRARRRPAQRRAEDVGLRAVRPARRLAHGAPARASTRQSCASTGRVDRGLARRAAARRARPVPRGLGRDDGGGAERRLRRRRAARAHRLPQLRQPRAREIGWELAARSTGSPRRPTSSAFPSSPATLALQRNRRQADPADADRRLRRPRSRRHDASRRDGDAATASSSSAGRGPGSLASFGRTRLGSRSRRGLPPRAHFHRLEKHRHRAARGGRRDLRRGGGASARGHPADQRRPRHREQRRRARSPPRNCSSSSACRSAPPAPMRTCRCAASEKARSTCAATSKWCRAGNLRQAKTRSSSVPAPRAPSPGWTSASRSRWGKNVWDVVGDFHRAGAASAESEIWTRRRRLPARLSARGHLPIRLYAAGAPASFSAVKDAPHHQSPVEGEGRSGSRNFSRSSPP